MYIDSDTPTYNSSMLLRTLLIICSWSAASTMFTAFVSIQTLSAVFIRNSTLLTRCARCVDMDMLARRMV
jgi:hypothetical protein